MRKGLSRVPLLAMRATQHDLIYRPAARLFSQIQSGGSIGEPIVFLGDSLTSGAGLPFGAAYPALVSAALGDRRFINLGVGGEVSGQILRRYRATPSLHEHPVVVWAGRNNYVTVDRVVLDLDEIVGLAGHDRYLVLPIPTGTYPTEEPGEPGWRAITELNKRIHERYGRHVVELPTFGRDDRWDEIHLSRSGHLKVANEVARKIEAAGW